VSPPGGVFIETYFYQVDSLAKIEFTVQIHPGEISTAGCQPHQRLRSVAPPPCLIALAGHSQSYFVTKTNPGTFGVGHLSLPIVEQIPAGRLMNSQIVRLYDPHCDPRQSPGDDQWTCRHEPGPLSPGTRFRRSWPSAALNRQLARPTASDPPTSA
jgi:hypothetical protein